MLDSALVSHDDIDRLRPAVYALAAAKGQHQRWIKVHDAYSLNADDEPVLGRGVARAAVYLVRDPRDVAVSLAHHTNTTIDAAIELMNAADGALCRGRKGPALQLRQKLLGWSGHGGQLGSTRPTRPSGLCATKTCAPTPPARSPQRSFAQRPATEEEIFRAIRYSDFSEQASRGRERLCRAYVLHRRSSAQARWAVGATS